METKLKTRCYYTEYVNHMIRFYMTCPDTLKTSGKRRADIENWCAVQAILHCMSDENKQKIFDIYKTHHNIQKAVPMYCGRTGTDESSTWMFLTKTISLIARRRGLA